MKPLRFVGNMLDVHNAENKAFRTRAIHFLCYLNSQKNFRNIFKLFYENKGFKNMKNNINKKDFLTKRVL